jgi:hypothetical protein
VTLTFLVLSLKALEYSSLYIFIPFVISRVSVSSSLCELFLDGTLFKFLFPTARPSVTLSFTRGRLSMSFERFSRLSDLDLRLFPEKSTEVDG